MTEPEPPDDRARVRTLVRSVRSDPDHFAERAILLATLRLAEPSRAWAERVREREPGGTSAADEARLVHGSARIARLDGAVSGTPFLLALVPAYVAVLWQQARMTMRIAALHGRDPCDQAMPAELLALRGVHATPELAAAALAEMSTERPREAGRRPLRTWIELVRRVLVLTGFLEAPTPGQKASATRRVIVAALGAGIWVCTWVFPITFMALMSWSCESATRRLAARAIDFYGGSAAAHPDHAERAGATRSARTILRIGLMALGVAIPLTLVAAAVFERKHGHAVLLLSALATMSGLALVAGLALAARR